MTALAVEERRVSAPPETRTREILVIGAGVLGLCTAIELTRRGHAVRVLDPGAANASSVAAGMIAPGLEAVLDHVTPERAALFRDARSVWDDFAADVGIAIDRSPALWAGGDAVGVSRALVALGFDAGEPVDAGLEIACDVLVQPEPALAAMRAALAGRVIEGRADAVERTDRGWRITAGGQTLDTDVIVLATGAAEAIAGLPAEAAGLVSQVTPIRGQIGRLALSAAQVTRSHGVYIAPSGRGAVIGATMEPRRRDLEPDVAAGKALLEAAEPLVGPVQLAVTWRVGVRGTTPDGLPMAGASGASGLFLALAPRRNGWLLGPLVGAIVADAIEAEGLDGGAGSPYAAALDPRRFSR